MSPRSCRTLRGLHDGPPKQRCARRSSWRSETGPLPSGRLPVFLGSAGLRRLTLRVSVTCRAALTEIETLRFERKECCVSQKK